MSEVETPTELAFLIMPGFPMACLTSAIEPLRAANEISGREAFKWIVVGETGEPVVSSAKVRFEPDVALGQLSREDAVYILSSPSGHFLHETKSNGILRRLARNGMTIGAFSGGVFPLSRSGLLEGYKCSVHWVYEAAFKSLFPQINATDRVISIDRKRETASGSAAVFDLMLRHIEQALGAETMTEVACWFQHPYVRGDDVAQRVPTGQKDSTRDMLPETVAEAVKLFAEHIEEPLRVCDVAASINVSTRQLDRSFQRATGQSPLKYYRMMRLEKARQLVLYSNDTIAEIALSVGYSSAAPFVRHYKQAYGITPAESRKQSNRFRMENNAPVPAI